MGGQLHVARCRPKLTCIPCHAPPCTACAVLKKFQGHLRSGSKLELLSLRELEDVDEPTARLLYNAGGWHIGQGGWHLRWVDVIMTTGWPLAHVATAACWMLNS